MDQPLASNHFAGAGPAKPTFPNEYRDWLFETHAISIGAETEAEYREFARQLERQFRDSAFYRTLAATLEVIHANYKIERGTGLLASLPPRLDLDVKRWDSFFEKTYRKNVRDNRGWPSAPERGWVIPPAWYEVVGDIVRTITIVRYLDGLEVVAKGIGELAATTGLSFRIGRVSRAEGYYATHVDVGFSPRVPRGVDVVEVPTNVEIQVTTELQANIRDLAHGHYERRRIETFADPTAWQWEYHGAEFATNYLGHVLHYLEGMIMRLREGTDERGTD